VACFVFWREICHPAFSDFCNTIGTLLSRADAAACPQLAKADFASSSQHRGGWQRIAVLHDMLVEVPLGQRDRLTAKG
jgi:hypothetical protein